MTTPDFLQGAVPYKARETSSASQEQQPAFLENAIPYQASKNTHPMIRSALQPPLGYAEGRYTWPLALAKMAAAGGAEDILKEMGEFTPVAEQAAQKANIIPSQGDIEHWIESKTGIPLEPQTELQKILRMAGMGAGVKPGGLASKLTGAVSAGGTRAALSQGELPEWAQDILSLGAAGAIKTPEMSIKTKPSGLRERYFEVLGKPTIVSPGKHQKISSAIEGDFRKITDDLQQSNASYKEMTANPNYKEDLANRFAQVQVLAEQIPGNIKSNQLAAFMKRRMKTAQRERKGITPSEAEETFDKEYLDHIGKVEQGPQVFRVADSVEQFRKNNRELAEYFDPSKSKGVNRGKRDALLEYNRAIEEFYDTVYPNSEFTKFFKEQNRLWTEASDVEAIEEQIGKIFPPEGKVNFKEASKLLDRDRANLRRPFQRIMGKKGFSNFEQLVHDLNSMRNPYALLKKSENAGFGKLARIAAGYILHPNLAKGAAAWESAKEAFRFILDKPQLAVNWRRGIDALKKGHLAEAEMQFEDLHKQVKDLAEKVRPMSTQGRTLPEGYAETRPEMATEVVPKTYSLKPSRKTINKYSLKEKPIPLTEFDENVAEGNSPKITKDLETLFKNQWNNLLPSEMYHYYRNPDQFKKDFGRDMMFGDFVKNPKLRKIYKDVLDVPVEITNKDLDKGDMGMFKLTSNELAEIPQELLEFIQKDPTFRVSPKLYDYLFETGVMNPREKGKIIIGPGYSPATVYSGLIHEGHHAFQAQEKLFKPFLETGKTKSYTTKSGLSISPFAKNAQYWEKRIEIGSRLAERAAIKELIKARNAAVNVGKYQRAIQRLQKKKLQSPVSE